MAEKITKPYYHDKNAELDEEKASPKAINTETNQDSSNNMSESLKYDTWLAKQYFGPATPTTDDPSTPALTVRVIFLGVIWGIFYGVVDTIFSFRTNPFYLPQAFLKIIVLPMGVFLAKVLPSGILNPGPFNIKEHVLVTVIASAAGGHPHGMDSVIMQHSERFFGDTRVNFWNSLAWVSVTQLVGLGVAGFLIRYLVKPAAMFWPSKISSVALFCALNKVGTSGSESKKYPTSRLKFFWMAAAGFFIYQWIPSYFMTTLGSIAILCLVTKNRTARFLGSAGSNTGVGLLSFSLDFTIGGGEHAMTAPFWVTCNLAASKIILEWVIVPLCYYFNIWNTPALKSSYYFPDGQEFGILNSLKIFNGTGFPVSMKPPKGKEDSWNNLLNEDYTINISKFEEHKPFYITDFKAVSYFCQFISVTSTISFICIWYGRDIFRMVKASLKQRRTGEDEEDIHNILMNKYYEFPEWMWCVWLAIFFILTLLVTQLTPFYTHWWATILAFVVGIFGTFLNGFLWALSGAHISMTLISETIIGFIIPGQTIACATFTNLCVDIMLQAKHLLGDLKVSHYLHVPPVAIIASQILGLVIGAFCNTGATFYVLNIMKEPKVFLDSEWLATSYEQFVNNTGVWGAIGPNRFFGVGTPYSSLLSGFLVGFVIPFLPYFLNKKFPHSWWHLFNPAFFFGTLWVGGIQATILNHLLIGFLFQWYIFKFKKEWFDKYVYIFAAALGVGAGATLFCMVLMNNLFPKTILSNSILRPANKDWYCIDGDPSKNRGGLAN